MAVGLENVKEYQFFLGVFVYKKVNFISKIIRIEINSLCFIFDGIKKNDMKLIKFIPALLLMVVFGCSSEVTEKTEQKNTGKVENSAETSADSKETKVEDENASENANQTAEVSKGETVQFEDGTYHYGNDDVSIKFEIAGDGSEIVNIEVAHNGFDPIKAMNGAVKEVNSSFVEMEEKENGSYDGPTMWYEFQSTACPYNLTVYEGGSVVLTAFDCTEDKMMGDFELIKK